jgi:hypothetical protein
VIYYYKVVAIFSNPNGVSEPSNIVNATPLSCDDWLETPLATYLFPAFPNPFNPETTIRFSVAENALGLHSTHVLIEVFNTRGQRVRTLVNEHRSAGNHSVTWNGRDDTGNEVSSGIYFYRMVADEFVATQRVILLK